MMEPVRRSLRLLAVLATLGLAASCAAPPPPTLVLDIAAGSDQNPDASGRPVSVAIRVYQLAGSAAFERADVFALTEHEAATLGTDDLGMEEVVVAPGEHRTLAHDLKPGTQALGFAVLFREIDRATWRIVDKPAPSGPTRRRLRTSGISAALSAE